MDYFSVFVVRFRSLLREGSKPRYFSGIENSLWHFSIDVATN